MELLLLKYLQAPGNAGPEAGMTIDKGNLWEHEYIENALFKFAKDQIQKHTLLHPNQALSSLQQKIKDFAFVWYRFIFTLPPQKKKTRPEY